MKADRRAFLFDMDGVLIDSTVHHVNAWALYLQREGITVDDMGTRMLGKRNDDLVRDFFPQPIDDKAVFDHGARKEELYRELMAGDFESHIVPGIKDFLIRHSNVRKGLVTNAEPANVSFVLDGAGIRPHFEVIVDGHQGLLPKPHPDAYLRAAELLGVLPGDCLVFEDSTGGVRAARAAGMRVVGIATTLPEIEGAEIMVRDFLSPVLESWLSQFSAA